MPPRALFQVRTRFLAGLRESIKLVPERKLGFFRESEADQLRMR